MRDSILLPPMAERPSPGRESAVSSWQEHLEDHDLKVVSFAALGSNEAGIAMQGAKAILVPSSPPYSDGKESAAMKVDTIHTLEAAAYYSVPVFSERPLADSFWPLQSEQPRNPHVLRFRQLVHEFGETVVDQDVSIIQEKLGVR